MVLPLNLTQPVMASLGEGADDVLEVLIEYLEDCGHAGSSPGFTAAWEVWRRAAGPLLEQASAASDLEPLRREGLPHLVRALAETHDFDVAIIPDLEIRTAKILASRARWDGVRVKLPVDGEVRWASFEGETDALSLRVSIWTREGERLFENLGGIEPATYFDAAHMLLVARGDLLLDPGLIRAGIHAALDPVIGPPLPPVGSPSR